METKEFNKVRRKDREVTDEAWIKAMLHRAPFGTLATEHAGQPYAKPTTFVYDEAAGAIYLHGAKAGRTRANLDRNPRVCFTVAEMGRLLSNEDASELSVEYASVVAFGRAVVVDDAAETRRALQLLVDKYFGHLKPRPVTDDAAARTLVYRIDIEQWSGKQHQEAPDHPGAFWYGEGPRG
ncbi:MAG: pyridoxamine 5'-phosphate oxidase family protein [Anaerolineae bacterium]|nr:pyridoxamine 5'-phosphate oxidase family protein [Anaerolineae bacterium]